MIDSVVVIKELWCCQRCHNEGQYNSCLFSTTGYKAIYDHISKCLGIYYDENGEGHMTKSRQAKIPLGSQATSRTDPMNQDGFDANGFLNAMIDWVIKQDVSYRSATSEDTRNLLCYGRDWLLPSVWRNHSTLSKYIEQAYEDRFILIKKELRLARSRIHLSADIWTSTNRLSLLGAVAHFISMYR
jgi:hypothetical protein